MGCYLAEVITPWGRVPVASSVPEICFGFEITDLSPTEDVDIAGGDLLTITGTGFPTNPSLVDVTLDNGVECVL